MKDSMEEATAAVGTETLAEVWKHINCKINHITRQNGGLIEQHNI